MKKAMEKMWTEERFGGNGCHNLDFDLVAGSEASFETVLRWQSDEPQGVFVVETVKFFCK